jgi:DNA-binding response OmpR family regulator
VEPEILVIGYDPQLKSRLVHALQGNNWRVRVMPNGLGAELISCLPQTAVIVLEMYPSSEGGWTGLQKIRERSTVPVIALVSDLDFRVRIECLDRGADYVMLKPVSARELRSRVGALLRRVGIKSEPMISAVSAPERAVKPQEETVARQT